MLGKKLKRLLMVVISTIMITVGFMTTLHSGLLKNNPSTRIEYKTDMTEYKIKQVINTNKLQTLEVQFTVVIEDEEYDKSRLYWLDKLSKTFTTRKITVQGDYKAVFTYDISKSFIRTNLDGTYTIILDIDNVEYDVVPQGEAKVNEKESLIGRYYSSTDSARVINLLTETAKRQVLTQENLNTTVNNAVNNLTKLLQTVGVDMSKIHIQSNLMEMEKVVK